VFYMRAAKEEERNEVRKRGTELMFCDAEVAIASSVRRKKVERQMLVRTRPKTPKFSRRPALPHDKLLIEKVVRGLLESTVVV
jgi:hypothetical protein